MKDVGIFWPFGLLNAISYILCQLGIFCGHFDTFFPFWYFVPSKIWQLCIHEHKATHMYVHT
jgi:hypothetical protein